MAWDDDPTVEVVLFRAEEPIQCSFCWRQAHYEAGLSYSCGGHLLTAVRKAAGWAVRRG